MMAGLRGSGFPAAATSVMLFGASPPITGCCEATVLLVHLVRLLVARMATLFLCRPCADARYQLVDYSLEVMLLMFIDAPRRLLLL